MVLVPLQFPATGTPLPEITDSGLPDSRVTVCPSLAYRPALLAVIVCPFMSTKGRSEDTFCGGAVVVVRGESELLEMEMGAVWGVCCSPWLYAVMV